MYRVGVEIAGSGVEIARPLFKCIIGSMCSGGELSEVPTTGGCPLLGEGTYFPM